MCIFCAETEKFVQLLLNIFFLCVAATRCISMFIKERLAASERYQCATASERKCAADIFFVCVAASGNISMFFKERAAASEIIVMKIVVLKESQLSWEIWATFFI